ncbi:hypothetical protein SI65_00964 [Aspergillus cristatus]|uniref:Uncharacterized protein n=1 Tax=Aspergillus cristatus TaxID=573508 RepID=A0A1E3BR00_ASPCR|nr:hypothetical protein SI65_00964 [Aspergillus cristatus]
MDDYQFPDGITFDKFIGNILTINGIAVTITDILSEKLQPDFNERRGVFQGLTTQNNTVILRNYGISELSDRRQSLGLVLRENFEDEHKALSACQGINTVPRLFAVDELVQAASDPFPNGYLRAIVMSRARGQSVVDIFDDLDQQDYTTIHTQLTAALEHMRLNGYVFIEPPTEHIFYEKSTSRM